MSENFFAVGPEYSEAILMETVDCAFSDLNQIVKHYFPAATDERFFKDCRLVLRHIDLGEGDIWYDLRRPEDTASLGFYQDPGVGIGYEFEFDDRFVLTTRKVYEGKYVESRRIVFGHDGEARLHRQYRERYGVMGIKVVQMTDLSQMEANKLVVDMLNFGEDVWPIDMLASEDPGLREFGLDVFHRSSVPETS